MDELTIEELGIELTEGEKRMLKLIEIRSRSPADFSYWSKAPYWSHDEAVALLLGREPEIINWDSIGENDSKWALSITLKVEYMKLRKLVLRGFEINEIGMRNSPAVFLEWAESKGIEIPEGLRQAVSVIKSSFINREVKTEIEPILKIKDEEIAVLQNQIEELKALVWDGFNENLATYSKELAIAVKAHGVISKNWKQGNSIKKQITKWLEENHPELSNEEKERIAKICNWQKSGGAPRTL